MPGWRNLLDEVRATGGAHNVVRRKYLEKLANLTGRNVIVYYSGWLQKPELQRQAGVVFGINDSDKNGFMATIHELDRTKGLDLVLHTPGGDVAATESLVYYLRAMFGTNIRALVPQIAMSGGTMIACACREIIMGEHSNLGPIDPQYMGLPTHGVIEEFRRAAEEIRQDQTRMFLWQPIIAKYSPTMIGECQRAIEWSNEITEEWLKTGMFCGDVDADAKAKKVATELGDHALTKSHSRHISLEKATDIGLKVSPLEQDGELQDALLTVHHLCIQSLADTNAVKLIENQNGVAFVQNAV